MKILASILQRPTAFIFLLIFVGGCVFVVSRTGSKGEIANVSEGELIQDAQEESDSIAVDASDEGTLTKDEKQQFTKSATGGPDVSSHIDDIVHADSGDAESEYVVVSETVEGPQECTHLEKYDRAKNVCFFECDSPKECDAIEAKINTELAKIEANYDDFSGSINEDDGEIDPTKIIARYAVDGAEFIELVEGKAQDKHKELWLTFAAISPDEISDRYIARYTIYRDAQSETAAFVEQISGVGPKWGLYINIDEIEKSTREENLFLLVHEFAHIMTLNRGQVDPTVEESVCNRFYSGEGCAESYSYIHKFYDRFWSESDLIKVLELEEGEENPVYTDHPDHFLTDYAATNPGEDIAESFTAFIFKQKNEKPETIAQEKVTFFYDFPDLVKFREIIRQSLGLQRAFERR